MRRLPRVLIGGLISVWAALLMRGLVLLERGHAGRSFGLTQILALTRGARAAPTSPIFGCGLGVLAGRLP